MTFIPFDPSLCIMSVDYSCDDSYFSKFDFVYLRYVLRIYVIYFSPLRINFHPFTRLDFFFFNLSTFFDPLIFSISKMRKSSQYIAGSVTQCHPTQHLTKTSFQLSMSTDDGTGTSFQIPLLSSYQEFKKPKLATVIKLIRKTARQPNNAKLKRLAKWS